MRTTVEIDNNVVREAMRLSGAKTKREVIDLSLNELIGRRRRARLLERIGRTDLTIGLDDLKEMREQE